MCTGYEFKKVKGEPCARTHAAMQTYVNEDVVTLNSNREAEKRHTKEKKSSVFNINLHFLRLGIDILYISLDIQSHRSYYPKEQLVCPELIQLLASVVHVPVSCMAAGQACSSSPFGSLTH